MDRTLQLRLLFETFQRASSRETFACTVRSPKHGCNSAARAHVSPSDDYIVATRKCSSSSFLRTTDMRSCSCSSAPGCATDGLRAGGITVQSTHCCARRPCNKVAQTRGSLRLRWRRALKFRSYVKCETKSATTPDFLIARAKIFPREKS